MIPPSTGRVLRLIFAIFADVAVIIIALARRGNTHDIANL